MTCTRCHHGFVRLAEGGFDVAALCRHLAECPVCSGGGHEWREVDNLARVCDCGVLGRARRAQAYNAARVPATLGTASLRGARPDPDAEAARLALRAFVASTPAPGSGGGIGLVGPDGTVLAGLMAATVANVTLLRGQRALWLDVADLLAAERTRVRRREPSGMALAELDDAEVLVLNRLGAGLGTEWERSVVDDIISRRYAAGKALLWASIYRVDGLLPPLAERIGVRAMSRLREMTAILEVRDGAPWGEGGVRRNMQRRVR